jgi:3-dehydroquinate dehydratase-2
MKFLILHGPNLNLLGTREPGTYGSFTLAEVNASIATFATQLGHEVEIHQSNSEGALVDAIQSASSQSIDGIVINPAGYTHTSVAIRDALLAVGLPTVEVHLTVPEAREEFRHISLIADIVTGRISGFGADGYVLGIQGLICHIEDQKKV